MPSHIYADDIVVEPTHPERRGEVRQVHNDASGLRLSSEADVRRHHSVSVQQHRQYRDSLDPPEGTVIVVWPDSHLQLVAVSSLRVVMRYFQLGDIVALPGMTMTGVVLDIMSTCTLQGLCTYQVDRNTQMTCGELPPSVSQHFLQAVAQRDIIEGVPASELKVSEDLQIGNTVIYHDWVGVVCDTSIAVALKLCNNTVVEVDGDSLTRGSVRVGDFTTTTKGNLRTGKWIYGRYDPNVTPCATIVQVRYTSVSVNWVHARPASIYPQEPAPLLERQDLESEDFTIYHLYKLPATMGTDRTGTTSYPHDDIEDGIRVRFIDPASAYIKYNDGQNRLKSHARADHMGYDLNVLDVVHCSTQVSVLWQDATTSQHDCTELRADNSVEDTHSAWPGEIAHSLEFEDVPGLENVTRPNRVGVIQSVDADQRMAKIRWCPSANVHFASILHEEGGDSVKELVQATIGLAAGKAEDVSLYDIELPGSINLSRGDMVLIHEPSQCGLQGVKGVNWFGMVVEDRLDGALTIRLGAAQPVQDVTLKREQVTVIMRYGDYPDGMDGDSDGSDFSSDEDDDDDIDDDEMEDIINYPLAYEATYEGEDGERMSVGEAEHEDWESVDEDDEHGADQDTAKHADEDMAELDDNEGGMNEPQATSETQGPPSYSLQDSAVPDDHHFKASPASTNPVRVRQIQKEHRIFQKPGAVPGGVYIHSWEARTDLWRVLFVGPQETPYADAPFVIDFYLPTDYPQSPPQAFFHSWAGESGLGAVGPVNPNLYEDGKICLSLLGTWDGEHRENWSPRVSTLLQVVVSLLGLVLVKEPYFNEAGYDVQMGTEEAKRPSILYNERVVLRSFNFAICVVAALHADRRMAGTQTLEPVLHWLYLSPHGACLLDKLYRRALSILSNSGVASSSVVAANGLTSMSQGACVSLRRVLTRLEELRGIS